jgi:hypothetical protein
VRTSLGVLLAVAVGCHHEARVPDGGAYRVEARVKMPLEPWKGISGLALDAHGGLWAIPERDRALLPVVIAPKPGLRAPAVPLGGVPDNMDTESIAVLSDGRFALGTEAETPARPSEAVLIVDMRGDRAEVGATFRLDYAPWGVTGEPNHGIEALCAAGGTVLAASETSGHDASGRFAPLWRTDERGGNVTPFTLRLTSEKGKISDIACRVVGDAIEVRAIERHFGVSRLLGFTVPRGGATATPPSATTAATATPTATAPTTIVPTVLLDVAAASADVPNLEGIAWLDDGRLALISDNHYGTITGPTEALVLSPAR